MISAAMLVNVFSKGWRLFTKAWKTNDTWFFVLQLTSFSIAHLLPAMFRFEERFYWLVAMWNNQILIMLSSNISLLLSSKSSSKKTIIDLSWTFLVFLSALRNNVAMFGFNCLAKLNSRSTNFLLMFHLLFFGFIINLMSSNLYWL